MRLAALCLSLAFVVLFSGSARAEASEADRATARALAIEGHEALQSKDFKTAADRFGRADSLVHAPTLVVDWARALQGLGRFVEAHEKYELVLRESIPPNAPKSWTRALEEAKKEVDALKPRLAWVTVILKVPAEAAVTLDGVTIPPAAVGVKRAADPGFPVVRVTAEGYEPHEETVSVGPGEEKTIEVALTKLPEASAAEPVVAAPQEAAPVKVGKGRTILTYVAFGVGGAGLIAGGVTGALALGKRSDLRSECRDDQCGSESSSKIDDYHLFGTISGVGFAVGVVGIGTGVVLLVTRPKTEQPPALAKGFSISPVVGLGMLGAEGTFQ